MSDQESKAGLAHSCAFPHSLPAQDTTQENAHATHHRSRAGSVACPCRWLGCILFALSTVSEYKHADEWVLGCKKERERER